jgi:membrane protease YdiL (CAAX protease family)
LATFLGVQLLVAVVAAVYQAVRHLRAGGAEGDDFLRGAAGFLIGAAFGGTVLAGLAVLRVARRALPGPLASGALAPIGWAPASARACVRAAAQGLGLIFVLALVSGLLPAPKHALGPMARLAEMGGWARAGWAFLAVACAPPVEELVFRGVFYTGLARAWRPSIAGAVTTVVFVALHGAEIGTYWPAWIAIGLLGALALRARIRTGSLLPAIALHATYNFGLVAALYAARGR